MHMHSTAKRYAWHSTLSHGLNAALSPQGVDTQFQCTAVFSHDQTVEVGATGASAVATFSIITSAAAHPRPKPPFQQGPPLPRPLAEHELGQHGLQQELAAAGFQSGGTPLKQWPSPLKFLICLLVWRLQASAMRHACNIHSKTPVFVHMW